MERTPANIVEKAFWENDYYWAHAQLPCRVDTAQAFDRSLSCSLAAHAPITPGERVLEVGCAPGKWLVFYAERFGARVSGIEYSRLGARLSRENFAAAGVAGAVHENDFFEVDPSPHELVLSLGFVEHFDDPSAALARHLDFLAPGGRLAVGVPSFVGLTGALQRLADPAHLALHNRAAMRRGLYLRFARQHDLELLHLGQVGGFDPAMICLAQGPLLSPRRMIPGAVIRLSERSRTIGQLMRREHRLLSSYLLAVYRLPA